MHHHFLDEYSGIDGILQHIDARIKLILSIVYIILVNLTPSDHRFSLVYYTIILLTWVLAAQIPLSQILRKVLIIIPFILVFSVFLFFYSRHDPKFILFIIGKSVLSLLAMILLVSTTSFARLLKAMGIIGIPRIFIMIFSFMYRYLFIIIDELQSVKMAKDSRTVGGSRRFHSHILANIVGVIFVQSYERSELVYRAMLARGFDGDIKTMDDFRLGRRDYYFALATFISLTFIKLLEYGQCLL